MKKMNKYVNLNYGIKLPVMIDGNEFQWSVSDNLFWYFQNERLTMTKKAFSEAGIKGLEISLENCYWKLAEYMTAASKDTLTAAINAAKTVYIAAGMPIDTLWACQWQLLNDCIAIQGMKAKGETKLSSYAAFRRAWFNALYNTVRGLEAVPGTAIAAKKAAYDERVRKQALAEVKRAAKNASKK